MGMLRRLSLQYQIAAGVILGVVILLSVFGWLAAQTIRQTRDLALEGRLDTANATAHAIDTILMHEAKEIHEASILLGKVERGQPERQLLHTIYTILENYRILVRLDENGQLLWAAPPSLDTGEWDLLSDPEIMRAVRAGGAIVRPSSPPADRVVLAVVIAPVRDESGEVVGFLAGELEASKDHPELAPLAFLGEETTALLVDDAGNIMLQEGPLVTESYWEEVPIRDLILEREPGTVIHGGAGSDYVEAYHPLRVIPAGVVVEVRDDRALAVPQTLEKNMIWIGIGGVMVASIGAWLHSRGVVRPIRELTAASAKMAGGSLDEPVQTTREDEVGQLARSFETMRQRLKESLEERRRWEEQLEARVRERTHEVQSLLGKVISAQEEERMRIAREMHDESAQDLVALFAGIQTAEAALPSSPEKAKQTLAGLKPLAKQALEEMRKNILDLRPSALDDLGLAPATQWYAESRLHPLGITLHWDASGELGQMPEPTAIAIFRITQEAINNVVKHAQASHVWMRLEVTDSTLAVEVRDDGCGFDHEALHTSATDMRGLGILGMKERASLIGGTVEIDSKQGEGTTVHVAVSLKPRDEGI